MTPVCNDDISKYEVLGRILNETSQINKLGVVKPQALYPRPHTDSEPGRENMFSNKLSVLRLCRGHHEGDYSWRIHVNQAVHFVAGSRNVFRGFLTANAATIKSFGLDIVPDGHAKNPYHAHILIPDFNVEYTDSKMLGSDIIPSELRERLDRLRMRMKTIILNRGESYPSSLNYASPSDSICDFCPRP